MTTERKIRVLMAKPWIDGHWRGLIVVTQALRNAGMEVVYGGNLTPEQIAEIAVQEDVNVIGLSFLVDTYMVLAPKIIEELRRKGKEDVLLLLGGIIFKEDIPALKEMGVAEVFGPGSDLEEMVEFVRQHAPA
ncbi:MAG: methylmalonyl-CoA mutase [Chloroflexi bacterium]|nr:methylmalonyl-CoA mutase [Chloroflexota bacterium]